MIKVTLVSGDVVTVEAATVMSTSDAGELALFKDAPEDDTDAIAIFAGERWVVATLIETPDASRAN